ncbi:AraC family transcriptional regulator [Chitinophaga filiformis]|uniref:helix-turn-helix domain-containing protein n=1 Tax=Chitinophaga filiformis TaxID=104663 RepID=UPI001F1B6A12|nr:AraC family transcriptional regulator [Chitinophaga filiformis]MCF6404435.1 AraC family transcriptional regulator [Chitinophaga filiformis]
MANPESLIPYFLYSCYTDRHYEAEQFVPEHVLTQVIAGSLVFYSSEGRHELKSGEVIFAKKNQLTRALKYPGPEGEMKSVSVFFDQAFLRDYSAENSPVDIIPYSGPSFIQFPSETLLKNYFESLSPYHHLQTNKPLAVLKQREALLLLLHLAPDLKNVLFDFSEPGKIDLEEFMNKHFRFNVDLRRFAYLTGRSLATFKRDFEKAFHESPSRWLQQKRLQEAYFQIKEKRRKPSDVYLEVGFEDLSHFSFAFKKTYGVAPSLV